jgi:hypothetical protein
MLEPENFDCDKYPPGSHCGDCGQCVPRPTNEELLAWAKRSPMDWLDEWLEEDMTGLF